MSMCAPPAGVDISAKLLMVLPVELLFITLTFRSEDEAKSVRLFVGVVVPIPTLPEVAIKSVEVPTAVLVPEKYATCPVVPVIPAHAAAFAETVPSAPTCKQRVPVPPVFDTTRPVVEAMPVFPT